MEAIHVEHLNFAYPGVDDTPGVAVFTDLDLVVEEGSFVRSWAAMAAGNPPLPSILTLFYFPAEAMFMFVV